MKTRTMALRGPRTTPAMLAEHAQLVAKLQPRTYITVAGTDMEPAGTVTVVYEIPDMRANQTKRGRQ